MSDYLQSIQDLEKNQGQIIPTSTKMAEVTVEEISENPSSITNAASEQVGISNPVIDENNLVVHYLAEKKVSVKRYNLKKK